MRQPAVREYLEERRKQMPVQPTEVINFLAGVLRGHIKTSQLRTKAALQIGIRAGLWKNEQEMQELIKEAATHE